MKNMASFRNFLQLGILLSLFQSDWAAATDRTIYFVSTGQNRTVTGLTAAAQSFCRVTITNPSSVQETVTVKATVQSVDGWTGSSSYVSGNLGTTPITGSGSISSCAGPASCAVVLNGNASVTINYSFTAYPPKPTATQTNQFLRCSGSIVAQDTGGSPGFVIASGVLVTFTESSQMHTDSTTGQTSATFGGIAVYSQIPITINRGKPF
jgi:hypothetical protein